MVEYVILILFVITVILVMQKYIARSMSGHWKSVGDSFGYGRQYDPNKTLECGFDVDAVGGGWYNIACYEEKCDCNSDRVTCGKPECIANQKKDCFDCKLLPPPVGCKIAPCN